MEEILIMSSELIPDQAILKTSSHCKKKEFLKAQKLYQAILSTFPENI